MIMGLDRSKLLILGRVRDYKVVFSDIVKRYDLK